MEYTVSKAAEYLYTTPSVLRYCEKAGRIDALSKLRQASMFGQEIAIVFSTEFIKASDEQLSSLKSLR